MYQQDDYTQREWLRALGLVDSMVVQAEYIYDVLPDDDERVQEAYETLVEALEELETTLRRAANAAEE